MAALTLCEPQSSVDFSSNSTTRLRDELLNETLLPSLRQVRATVASCRTYYNLNQQHSRLGWLTPPNTPAP